MNRELAERAIICYHSLSEGVMQGDPLCIESTRQLLVELAHEDDENVHRNIIRAHQAKLLEWAKGPVDDLQIALSQVKSLALLILENSDECSGQ